MSKLRIGMLVITHDGKDATIIAERVTTYQGAPPTKEFRLVLGKNRSSDWIKEELLEHWQKTP